MDKTVHTLLANDGEANTSPLEATIYVFRTRKRVILGHHVIMKKGLKFAQHHDRHTVTCVYIHSSR